VGDGTGLAEALLQLEGFRVLSVHETLAEVVIELGEVRAGAYGTERSRRPRSAICSIETSSMRWCSSTSTCGTTPGRGHDEERLVRERAAAVGVLDDPSSAWTRATCRSRYVPAAGASGC
jgi:hypothetical protein